MLQTMFIEVLNMSLTASFVIIFILLARLLLKKAPSIFSYGLWLIPLFRLICPFSFESMFSLLPAKASQTIIHMSPSEVDLNIINLDQTVPIAVSQADISPLETSLNIASLIWIGGILVLLLYSLNSLIRLKRQLRNSSVLYDHVFISSNISTAFVLGLLKPKIYLPHGLNETERTYILLHENMHIKRRDHIIKLMSFLVLCLHWFNPLVWIAFFISGKDMEMSCDERVIQQLGQHVKKDYSSSLLTLTTGKRIISGMPLAFGEGNTKERIKNVLSYKKTSIYVIGITLIVCLVIAICCLTNPVTDTIKNPYVQEYDTNQGSVDAKSFETIHPDFAIGEAQDGQAVFKNPQKAFKTFQTLYSVGIDFIQQANDLPDLSNKSYELYSTYGWQMTGGTENQLAQALFVSKFLDIYDNSFSTRNVKDMTIESTTENTRLTLDDVINLSGKGKALSWEDFENYSYREVGSGLYIRLYEISDLFSLWIGGTSETDTEPMYIILRTNTESKDAIDIRTEAVEDFINQHKDDLKFSPAVYSYEKIGKNKEILISTSELNKELAEKIIFDGLTYFVSFEGSDLNELKEYYIIHQTSIESNEIIHYYIYQLDNGNTVFQNGQTQRYSYLSNHSYESFEKLIQQSSE